MLRTEVQEEHLKLTDAIFQAENSLSRLKLQLRGLQRECDHRGRKFGVCEDCGKDYF